MGNVIKGLGMAFPDWAGERCEGCFWNPVALGFTLAFVPPVKHTSDTWTAGE